MTKKSKGQPPKNPISQFIDDAYKHRARINALLAEANVAPALAYEAALDQMRMRSFDRTLAQAFNTAYTAAKREAFDAAQKRKSA